MAHTTYIIENLSGIVIHGSYACRVKILNGWKFEKLVNNVVNVHCDIKQLIFVDIDDSLSNHDEILETIKEIFNERFK